MSVSPSFADGTSSSLLVRVRNRDMEAWRNLVKWIGPFILRWCHAAKLQAADCEDISQDVLQRVWHRLSTFRKENPHQSFRAWVYTITRNRIVDLHRQNAPRPLDGIDLVAESNSREDLELKQRAIWLILQEIVIKNAKDPGFKAFYRTAVDGLPAPQVAQELGLKAWTVRQHRSRWIKRLRDRLQVDYGELLAQNPV